MTSPASPKEFFDALFKAFLVCFGNAQHLTADIDTKVTPPWRPCGAVHRVDDLSYHQRHTYFSESQWPGLKPVIPIHVCRLSQCSVSFCLLIFQILSKRFTPWRVRHGHYFPVLAPGVSDGGGSELQCGNSEPVVAWVPASSMCHSSNRHLLTTTVASVRSGPPAPSPPGEVLAQMR